MDSKQAIRRKIINTTLELESMPHPINLDRHRYVIRMMFRRLFNDNFMREFDLLVRAGEVDMSRLFGWRAILREVNDTVPKRHRLTLDDPVYTVRRLLPPTTPPSTSILPSASCSNGAVAATAPKKRIHCRDVSLSELMSSPAAKVSDEERAFRVVRDHSWQPFPDDAAKVQSLIKLIDELDAQGLRHTFVSAIVSGRIILSADLKIMLPSVLVIYFGDNEMRNLLRRSAAGGSF